jgi:V8-like Glu-specific endopeptidase
MDGPPRYRRKLGLAGLALLPTLLGFDAHAASAAAFESDGPCIDPRAAARAVVSVTWRFVTPRRVGRESVIGQRATAWFYRSPRLLVTAAHFANELPREGWQDAEVHQADREGEPDVATRVRLRVTAKAGPPGSRAGEAGAIAGLAADVAIMELQDPFPNALVLPIRSSALAKDARVLVLGYPRGRMQAVRGIVRLSAEPTGRYAGLTLLEVQGSNRLLLNEGASGAPVLDCGQGRVVAVLNGLLTGPSLPFLPPDSAVIPTPWGSPTNTAVPASILPALQSGPP